MSLFLKFSIAVSLGR